MRVEKPKLTGPLKLRQDGAPVLNVCVTAGDWAGIRPQLWQREPGPGYQPSGEADLGRPEVQNQAIWNLPPKR